MIWVAVALLILCPILAAKYLREAQDNGEVDRFVEARDELGRTVRATYEPTLLRFLGWLNRKLSA